MTECPHCGMKFTGSSSLTDENACPNCGKGVEFGGKDTASSSAFSFINRYINDVWTIIVRPTLFFQTMPIKGGVSGPLAFALITHWIGSAMSFLWHALIGGTIGSQVQRMFQMMGNMGDIDDPGRSARYAQLMEAKERFMHWFMGAGSVVADPFLTLAKILFTSFLVYLGVRILVTPGKDGSPRDLTFESALRVVCFGMTPSILTVVPLVGGGIAGLVTVIVTVIGAREVYRIGTGRAIAIALFPQILFFGIVMAIFAVIVIGMFKLLTMAV